jgi:hypothetical protein
MDDDLDKIYVEGHGGGQIHETYELAHYFFLHHTSTDCWDKRQKRGYFFTMGDEAPYDTIRAEHVKRLIGDTLQADIPTSEVVRALEERYNVFHIIVEEGSYPNNAAVEGAWRKLLGERVLKLENQNSVAELIAMTIGLTEGTAEFDNIKTDLADVGVTVADATSVSTALTPYATSGAIVKGGKIEGDLPSADNGAGAIRL